MKTFYEQTIIDAIDFSGYEDDADIFGDYPLYTDIQNIYFIFKKEYGFSTILPSSAAIPPTSGRLLKNASSPENGFLTSYPKTVCGLTETMFGLSL